MTKYTDTTAIINIIGNIYKNPSILDDERYKFIEDYFPNEFHRIVFGAIYNLHLLGTKNINLNTIDDYLSQRPKQYGIYKTNKGQEYLEKAGEYADIATFPYYYNRIKKLTLLRMYQEKCGMDLSFLYDADNILDIKKKQQQEDWLDNTSVEQIAEIIDKKIQDIRLFYADDFDKKSVQAGEGIDDLIDTFMTTPDFGYPMYGDYINTISRGARLKKVYMRSAATGLGKAIPDYTIIPTPEGNKRVDEIQVGDVIFGDDGEPVMVRGVYPQETLKTVYEVVFEDGRKAECCIDHIWSYEEGTGYTAHKKRKTNTLRKILESSKGKFTDDNRNLKFRVPQCLPVDYEEEDYKVSPFALGALLAGGGFQLDEKEKGFRISTFNDDAIKEVAKELDAEPIGNSFSSKIAIFKKAGFKLVKQQLFSEYPEYWDMDNTQIYLPKKCFKGTSQQRLDLLAGMIAVRGVLNDKSKNIYLYINSLALRNDIITICNSLGFSATWKYNNCKAAQSKYCLMLFPDQNTMDKLVRVNSMRKQLGKIKMTVLEDRSRRYISIVTVNKTDKKVPMTCFTVDNESHLFLMNNYIVTHNTRTMIADACTFACNKIYNPYTRQWEENGTKEPTLFISTEQEKAELQSMMLCFVSGVNEDHILTGKYEEGELERVRQAAAILRESPLYIEELPDFSMEDIENTIKRNIRDNGVKYVAFDYVHSSMKILSEISSKAGVKGLREDNILFMIGVRLKDLANQYEVFILTATQLNGSFVDAKEYDQNLLRGAKSLGDWTKLYNCYIKFFNTNIK